jgi:hypothetical protein
MKEVSYVYIFVNHQQKNKCTASGIKIREYKIPFLSLAENT